MSLLAETFDFVLHRSPVQIFSMFWYFFVFEFTRYILLDFYAIPKYLLRRKKEKPRRELARARLYHEKPLVTFLIPGLNEAHNIPRLIQSIRSQTYAHSEVIVVDDGSTDGTHALCQDLLSQGKIDLFFSNSQRGGQSSAKNLAIRYARGKYVVQLDADSALHKRALEEALIPYYIIENLGAVGGDLRVLNNGVSLSTALQTLEYLETISVGRIVTSTLGILRIVSGAWGVFPTSVVKQLKGFDPGPGLDGDLTLKIRKLGYRVLHEPASVCYTNVPDTFAKLSRQRFRWERSVIRMRMRKHRDMLNPFVANFRLTNFITVADNFLYHVVFNFKWWLYILWIFLFYFEYLKYILIIKLVLYTTTNLIQYLLAVLVLGSTMRKQEYLFAVFLPLMPFYSGLYMRIVRLFAHLLEIFFKVSYLDPWSPWKVSRVARKERL